MRHGALSASVVIVRTISIVREGSTAALRISEDKPERGEGA